MGKPVIVARNLLGLHRKTYKTFWEWSDSALDHAMLHGSLQTVFGWTIHVGGDANPRSLRNFPMQANGAEMLRLACIYGTEGGIKICAPVHDAVLIEAPLEELDSTIGKMQAAMAKASRVVLDGFELRTGIEQRIEFPDHYMDKRGVAMWGTVMGILDKLEVCTHAT
jgi:DNA polymerase I-like protein with 3'-5' exonuclease and polymerase domains